MAGCVDQVKLIGLPVLRGIVELYCVGLYGNPALALQIHIIQQLLCHIPLGDRLG